MTQSDTAWRAAIEATLERSANVGELAGGLVIVWHGGDVALNVAVGECDIAGGIAMGGDAIFQIASMTKPIVSVAALQIVEEGTIKLNDPIERWLPELGDRRVLDDREGSLARTHAATRPITVDDLLTHRAGFGYAFAEKGPIAPALERTLGNVLHLKMDSNEWLLALGSLPLLSDPGAQFIYGHSTEVLGCLIARIDGVTLGESLRRRVLEPLGMSDTAFYVPVDKRTRLAHMYRRVDNRLEDATDAPDAPPLFEAGGGGLYSTANDYLAFSRMFLEEGRVGGARLLSKAMCQCMTQNHLTMDQRARARPLVNRISFSTVASVTGSKSSSTRALHSWPPPARSVGAEFLAPAGASIEPTISSSCFSRKILPTYRPVPSGVSPAK